MLQLLNIDPSILDPLKNFLTWVATETGTTMKAVLVGAAVFTLIVVLVKAWGNRGKAPREGPQT